jgi:hypothetical protein
MAGAWALERCLSSPSTSPSRRQDNMDRASQVLAQGVPPGVPKSYSPPPRIIASVYVLGIGAGRNPGCLTSEKVSFKLAESHCQGRRPS